MVVLCFVLVLGSFSPCLSPLSHSSSLSSSSPPSSHPSSSADLYTTSRVRSRSLLFYDERAPLEASSAPSDGGRLRSEGHAHIQTRRHTADAHRNRTSESDADQRDNQAADASKVF